MAYSYRTTRYQIPARAYMDTESGSENIDAADKIEHNLIWSIRLHGATSASHYGVIEEGNYIASFVDNESYVDLESLKAVINDIFIVSEHNVKWEDIPNNSTKYLAASLIEASGESSRRYGHWKPVVSNEALPGADSLILAKVVTTDSDITIYIAADDIPTKIYSKWIGYHREQNELDHPEESVKLKHIEITEIDGIVSYSGLGANDSHTVVVDHSDQASFGLYGSTLCSGIGADTEATLNFGPADNGTLTDDKFGLTLTNTTAGTIIANAGWSRRGVRQA